MERKFNHECCGLEQWWQITHTRTTCKHVTVSAVSRWTAPTADSEIRYTVDRVGFISLNWQRPCVVWLCNLCVTKYVLLCIY